MSIEKIEENACNIHNRVMFVFFNDKVYQNSFKNSLISKYLIFLKYIHPIININIVKKEIARIEKVRKKIEIITNKLIKKVKKFERDLTIKVKVKENVVKYKCYLFYENSNIVRKIKDFNPQKIDLIAIKCVADNQLIKIRRFIAA